jgi:hypothetical protein
MIEVQIPGSATEREGFAASLKSIDIKAVPVPDTLQEGR